MKYLIDTHIFIWWMEKNPLLTPPIYQLLNDPKNQIYLSVASIWEILIKKAKKKLTARVNVEKGIAFSKFTPLPILLHHVLTVEKLPSIHHDPFDRILVAQAIAEKLTVVTTDEKIKKYKVKVL